MLICCASTVFAIPAGTTLQLAEESGFNALTFTLEPGSIPKDTEVSTFTGHLELILDIDPLAGTASGMTLTGGRIDGTDMTFRKSTLLSGSYSLTMTGLSGFMVTPSPPGGVDPITGAFDASDHDVVVDQGSGSGFYKFFVTRNPISHSFSPEEPVQGSGEGTGTISLAQTSSTAWSRTFDVTLLLPVNVVDQSTVEGQTVTITAVGTMKMTGTIEVGLTDYFAWTIKHGIGGTPASEDTNHDRVPNGIAWALGLGPDDDARPFLPVISPSIPGAMQITLPAGGTVAPLTPQVSQDMVTWTDLPPGRLSSGIVPIPPGTTGTLTIPPPASSREFIRLHSAE